MEKQFRKAFPSIPYGAVSSEFMKYKEHFVRKGGVIVDKEIIQDILTSTLSRFKSKAQNFSRKVKNVGRRLTGGTVDNTYINPDAPPTRESIRRVGPFFEFNIDPIKLNAVVEETLEAVVTGKIGDEQYSGRTSKINLRERPSKKFQIRNIKLIGFSELSLSYDQGEPLLYTVTLAPDQILPVEE